MQVERHEVMTRVEKIMKLVIDNCDDPDDKEELKRLKGLLISNIWNMNRKQNNEYAFGNKVNLN